MWASIWTLWAGVIGGWAAVVAGKVASNTIEHGEAIHEIMEKHENMALLTMGCLPSCSPGVCSGVFRCRRRSSRTHAC